MGAKRVSRCVVSTDDDEISDLSVSHGAEVVRRPPELSGDEASSEAALIHTLEELARTEGYTPSLVVFLQCTSPVRKAQDIDDAIAQLEREGSDSALSVCENHRFIWEAGPDGPRSLNYDYRNRRRRQDLAPQFMENGSIYLFKPWILERFGNRLGGRISLYVMPEAAAYEIDSRIDFDIIATLIDSVRA